MSSSFIRSLAARSAVRYAPRPLVPSSLFHLTRTYAASPGQSSNVSGSTSSSPESQTVNNARATDDMKQADTASAQTPISNPEKGGLGGSEETTESQSAMKQDPNQSDEEKRKKVLEYGQNKSLEPENELKPNEGRAGGVDA